MARAMTLTRVWTVVCKRAVGTTPASEPSTASKA